MLDRCPESHARRARAPAGRRIGLALCLALTSAPLVAALPARGAEPLPVAVADFDYRDTSGEPRDQRAEHAEQLKALGDRLRAALAGSGRYRIVALTCGSAPCPSAGADPDAVVAAARQAGARLLVYGGLQKMSTLIQYLKAQVVDLEANALTFDRLLTFRGDNEEAWQRAEKFLARELMAQELSR
jgi:hypothetical protein